MENELKPCPFCGGEVSMTYNSVSKTFNVWHKGLWPFRNCYLREPFMIEEHIGKSLAGATRLWNRRYDNGDA